MEANRLIVRILLEVVHSLVHRLGFHDLAEKCEECRAEADELERLEKKEG